ncbi:serine/threonine protein phosphatase 1 [Sphingomonas vulcanisoli]|uniref:Serine/threonine protein phosphatase 1 n=1 Tax=Sphingomonas vulcanisoli TaxID=1658060 RepID=A0ABX0TST5_9SPHN|nr:metallophosphoesterase family protein [Sphingomonas vulcanisoli]NIJ08573.1 serine/threonine protein phosphatase 1 [Sphingomonas vulcanisoli]
MFSSLFRKAAQAEPEAPPAIPPGERVYAVGDIHGRADLFDDLLARIAADAETRGTMPTTLILLGDLIDRGPDSAGVVQRAIALSAEGTRFHVIMGNHEEVFLAALAGDEAALSLFERIGGVQTMRSYGLEREVFETLVGERLVARLNQAVPPAHLEFLARMEDRVQIGDYLFVHAGIRPGVPIDEQDPTELRWIRKPFLEHVGYHGLMIVHGHSISYEPELRANRLGIDTGAYQTNRLTALGLEGTEHWLLHTDVSASG